LLRDGVGGERSEDDVSGEDIGRGQVALRDHTREVTPKNLVANKGSEKGNHKPIFFFFLKKAAIYFIFLIPPYSTSSPLKLF